MCANPQGSFKRQRRGDHTLFLNGQGTKSNEGAVGNCSNSLLRTNKFDTNSNQRVEKGQDPEETQINPYLQDSIGTGARPSYSR